MGDIRVNEDVPFVLDRVSGMEQNSEEYRVEPVKNEVAIEMILATLDKNVTPQYWPIMQLITVISLLTLRTSDVNFYDIRYIFLYCLF